MQICREKLELRRSRIGVNPFAARLIQSSGLFPVIFHRFGSDSDVGSLLSVRQPWHITDVASYISMSLQGKVGPKEVFPGASLGQKPLLLAAPFLRPGDSMTQFQSFHCVRGEWVIYRHLMSYTQMHTLYISYIDKSLISGYQTFEIKASHVYKDRLSLPSVDCVLLVTKYNKNYKKCSQILNTTHSCMKNLLQYIIYEWIHIFFSLLYI